MEKSIQVVKSEKHVIRFTAEDVEDAIMEKVKRMDNRIYRYKRMKVDVDVTRGYWDGATVTVDVEEIAETETAPNDYELDRRKQRKLDLQRCEPGQHEWPQKEVKDMGPDGISVGIVGMINEKE